jgi:hypothetical protein
MARMSDDELRSITDQEMRQAVGWFSGKLAAQRQKAMSYYLAKPTLDLTPPEIEGRSSVVSPDVRNTIESMLPQLMVKFAGSERVVEFEPTKPGDEAKAEQCTDYLNHCFHVRNNGELITYNWMKDALLSKNGIVKVWWDDRREEKREEYRNLNQVELAELMDDDEVEVIEQKSYPDEQDAKQREQALQQLQQQLQQAGQAAQAGDPQAQQAVMQLQQQMAQIQAAPPVLAYDVVCKRTKIQGCVRVENVPPEEFLISRKAKTIEDASFVAHRVARTQSDLISMGYKNVDQISGDDQSTALNMERIERLGYDDELAYLQADTISTPDDSQRIIWVTECYVRCDYDGDGISELRKVTRAGNQILDNEIVDCAPFVSITPVPMPHKFFGLSVADLALEAQKIKTNILRGMLDNMYLSINGRYFAVDGQVNLDDLLASRPGGVVRVKQPGAAGRLDQGMGDSQLGMSMMETMQGFLEDSTGWTRYNQGADGDSLNQTATGVNIVTNRADMRLDLIARNFAEGFRDLFRMMLKLVSQYSTKADVIRLRGQWVNIDPREWRHQFDVSINVGLGTGNKDQQVAHLMALLQQQQFGLQVGTATPENVYQSQQELVKALGFKTAEKFFSDPAKAPPRPQPPAPEQIKAQAAMQLEQMRQQADAQKFQAQTQMEMQRIQMEAQATQAQKQAELQVQQANDERDAVREQARLEMEAQLKQLEADNKAVLEREKLEMERWRATLEAETKVLVAQIAHQAKQGPEVQTPAEQVAEGGVEEPSPNAALAMAMQGFTEALAQMRAPRTIIRGPDGRAQGIA